MEKDAGYGHALRSNAQRTDAQCTNAQRTARPDYRPDGQTRLATESLIGEQMATITHTAHSTNALAHTPQPHMCTNTSSDLSNRKTREWPEDTGNRLGIVRLGHAHRHWHDL
jgi:hypothetical protein